MNTTKKHLKVSFEIYVYDYPESRLTKEFIAKQIEHIGEVTLDAFDETIHEIKIEETE
nr:MAG TPA: hypothetical protein [Caudoviricetes sp.]